MKLYNKKLTTLLVLLMLFLCGCESSYKVNLISDDGLVIETFKVPDESIFTEPEIPVKEGYTFLGWYSDSEYEVAFDFTQPIIKDVSVFSKWDINTYSLTFKDHEGVIQWVYQTQYDTDLSDIVVSSMMGERENYVFSGWDIDMPDTMPAHDLVFKAEYTFIFGEQLPGFINVPDTQIVEYGTNFDFMSLGIRAIDYIDGDLTSDISVNITDTSILTVGEYEAIYSITDNDGNESSITIDFTVLDTSTNFVYNIVNENEIEISGCFPRAGTDIIIPSSIGGLTVTTIGDWACNTWFFDSPTIYELLLTSVVLPDSIISIGRNAFSHNNLTDVIIPDGVEYIGEYAFSYNPITSFIVSDNNPYYSTIDGVLFDKDETTLIRMIGDTLRTTYTIPDTVTTIGDSAFAGNQFTSIIIPDSVTSIGESAFGGDKLESVTLGDSVISIGDYAFRNNQLSSLFIPDSVTTIGNKIFGDDQSISYIVSESNPYFAVRDDVLFSKDITILIDTQFKDIRTSYTIPDSVEIIRDYAFDRNELTNITIPENVTSIGDYAFYSNELTSIIIPDSVINIGYRAFSNNQLASLTLGVNVTTIKSDSFSSNQLTSLILPNSVETIGNYAFYDNQLTSVILPEGLTMIENSLFKSNLLSEIVIPDSVVTIGDDAFAWNNLTSLVIPNGVESIGDYAFSGNQLTSLTIPNSVITIGEAAFFGNDLTSIIIPESIISISDNVFRDNKLTHVSLPDNVTSIGDHAFYENQLSNVILPSSLLSIGEHAFDGNQLTSVELPNSLISIDNDAFSNNQLTSITIPSSVTTIEKNAFANNQISSITLSEGITTFGRNAFADNQISSVTILGDKTTYNSVWFKIGFPRSLTPQ